MARGQCLEQYGEGEAYLPVLEALGRLARDDGDGRAAAKRSPRHAPTWVSQLAALDAERPRRAWRRDGAIATMPARMLREMADALEVFTRQRALLLVLEDLQWSDPSTRRPDRLHRAASPAGAAAGDRHACGRSR